MSILTTADRDHIATKLDDADGLVVVTLCAAWCNTCKEFRSSLAGIAAARPGVAFLWVDIEDDADLCGDVDVEDFPTLLAVRGDDVLHFGPSLPLANVVARLVDELASPARAGATVAPEVIALARALRQAE